MPLIFEETDTGQDRLDPVVVSSAVGTHDRVETEPFGFARTMIGVRHRTHLTGESDLAPGGHGPDRDTEQRRRQGERNREVGSRIVKPDSPDDTHVDVATGEREPGMALQDGHDLMHPCRLQSLDGTARLWGR
jgi:hypothetical protein